MGLGGLKEGVELGKLVGKSRWFVLFVSFLIISFSGATYIFGLYSPAIKSALDYDQKTLNTLGFFKDLGANLGIFSGLLNEVVPAWFVLAVGGVMNLTGFLLVWLSVTGRMGKPKNWQMFTYIAIGSNSQTFANTGALVTCVKNFPQSRGIVLGILKGFAGLSGAIFTQIYHALYGNDPTSLILLIGWMPCLVCFAFMFVVRPMNPTAEKNELRRFYSFLCIALALAGFLMVIIIIENHVKFPPIGFKLVATVVAVFLLLPLSVVAKAELDKLRTERGKETEKEKELPSLELAEVGQQPNDGETEYSERMPVAEEREEQIKSGSSVSVGKWYYRPKRGEDFTIPQALVSVDMWILFIATTCGVGAALTAIDNMGQIGYALGFSTVDVSTFVSLISIWNFLGRVTSGFCSELLLQKFRLPRPVTLTFVLTLACVGHLFIAFALPGSLYVASIVLGFSFGAQWPVLFAMISEFFGLKYYSTLYNLAGSASPLGNYILSVRVAGYLYDLEASKQHGNNIAAGVERVSAPAPAPAPHRNDLLCSGVTCFRLTFIIMTLVSLFGAFISGFLVFRTKDFYKGDLYAKYQSQSHQPKDKSQSQSHPTQTTVQN